MSRTLLVDNIHDQINRIYYVLLAMLTDAQIETTSDYWLQFGMTGVGIVYPTIEVVNGISVPLIDFTIQPASNVVTHWEDLVDEIEVCLLIQAYTLFLPLPRYGDGVLFSGDFFLSFFVSLSATLRENGWTDLHEIFREGVE